MITNPIASRTDHLAGNGFGTNSSGSGSSYASGAFGDGRLLLLKSTGGTIGFVAPSGSSSSANPTGSSWKSIAFGNGRFVVVGTASPYATASTDDGATYMDASGLSAGFNAVAYGNGVFTAVGASGNIATSTDGLTWSTRSSGVATQNWTSVAYGEGKFVAVGPVTGVSQVRVSSNLGATWSAGSQASDIGANPWQSVAYGDGAFVAVSSTGTTRSMYSTDGTNWINGDTSSAMIAYKAITYDALGGSFIAVASTGSSGSRVAVGTSAGVFSLGSGSNTSTNYQSVTYGAGKVYVASGTTNAYSSGGAFVSQAPGQLPAPTATAGEVSANLTWNTGDQGTPVVSGYKIEYRLTSSAEWTTYSDDTGTTTQSATVSGLAAGHAYEFRVSAVNSLGTGPASDASNQVTPTGDSGITFNTVPSITYGETDNASASASLGTGEDIAYSATSPDCSVSETGTVTGVAAGTDNCVVVASIVDSSDTVQSSNSQLLSVGKGILSVTPDAKSRTFGQAVPTYSFSVTGFVNAETADTAAGYQTPTCTSAYTVATNVADSPLSISCSGGQADNHTFDYQPASLTIVKADQTITIQSLPDHTGVTAPFSIASDVSSSSGLTVGLSSDTPAICTVSGSTVTLLASGTCTIRGTQAGGDNYNPATDVTSSFNYIAATAPAVVGVTIEGQQVVGQTLKAVPVGATGTEPLTIGYQWKSSATSDGTFTAIPGATAAEFVVPDTQVGKFIAVDITITNASPSTASASSQPTPQIVWTTDLPTVLGVICVHGSCANTDLSGLDLSGAQLAGVNFSGANLTGTNLSNAVLTNAKFTGATLQKANLHGAKLRNADFRKADLRKADLRKADLRKTDHRRANLRRADLRKSDLRKADLRKADLRMAKLAGANLHKAKFSN